MTSEMKHALADPNVAIQIAIGDPIPALVPQDPSAGLKLGGVYAKAPKRFVLKSGKLSRDDQRVFDADTKRLVMNSHHPGKNPYGALDPLGLGNSDDAYQRASMGAEWESLTDVTGHGHGFPSFQIRPKKLSRHGRQYIKRGRGGEIIMNVGKVGKLASMSVRPNFCVGPGDDDDTTIYTIVGDMMGRTMRVTNEKDELVCVMAKTTKALIMNAALGAGSESTIDIAPGVDCSMMLAVIFGLQQVGEHFAKDAFNGYVMENVKEAVVDNAVEAAGAEGLLNQYVQGTNQASHQIHQLTRAARFMQNNFFS